ncbi:hypothetical protein GGX14DRAFT_571994 [Mycena pura]|uniref:Uncharacterized protein n=1 Tax=Mycena pura TaxID=153505 RepID=A0AAD6V655_9AGAR|nr:hypothetical protein GGX14DRAFT_571994 [Mycena pura]
MSDVDMSHAALVFSLNLPASPFLPAAHSTALYRHSLSLPWPPLSPAAFGSMYRGCRAISYFRHALAGDPAAFHPLGATHSSAFTSHSCSPEQPVSGCMSSYAGSSINMLSLVMSLYTGAVGATLKVCACTSSVAGIVACPDPVQRRLNPCVDPIFRWHGTHAFPLSFLLSYADVRPQLHQYQGSGSLPSTSYSYTSTYASSSSTSPGGTKEMFSKFLALSSLFKSPRRQGQPTRPNNVAPKPLASASKIVVKLWLTQAPTKTSVIKLQARCQACVSSPQDVKLKIFSFHRFRSRATPPDSPSASGPTTAIATRKRRTTHNAVERACHERVLLPPLTALQRLRKAGIVNSRSSGRCIPPAQTPRALESAVESDLLFDAGDFEDEEGRGMMTLKWTRTASHAHARPAHAHHAQAQGRFTLEVPAPARATSASSTGWNATSPAQRTLLTRARCSRRRRHPGR